MRFKSVPVRRSVREVLLSFVYPCASIPLDGMTEVDAGQMGIPLRVEVERQLLDDLAAYGVPSRGLRIDWSDSCQEGHVTYALGGTLEDQSSVTGWAADGSLVAEGWMDFIHGGGSNPLFVFWYFLTLHTAEGERAVKDQIGIPDHVWKQLPDKTRDLMAKEGGYDARWSGDPHVVAWRQSKADA
jgi:hypothetical protein